MRTPSWVELLVLMVHGPGGPDPTVRGTIRSRDAADARGNAMDWVVLGGAPQPVMAGAGATPGEDGDVVGHVWRDGARIRLEHADRVPRVIADERTVWSFSDDPTTPTAAPRSTSSSPARATTC
ncbi:hypothetical protein [Cellulomonas sp. ATA003]|uniref:hypothetical protein n=1 Tax=Cellulomonas sp. ATA003 TaxID=3073064 RepID=UPI0028737E2B|nr:hypothetical protein [Cellulomonas sp. ATA003]WNB86086.1 hypothetical protein REH70_02020 [Cellulomonas sp. ATA003]